MDKFIKALVTGMVVSIAGTVYLSTDEKLVGAVLFSFALMMVVKLGVPLFTGMIGYINKETFVETFVVLAGNFTGIYLYTRVIQFTRIYEAIVSKSDAIVAAKLSDTNISVFILAAFCGAIMFMAVETYKRSRSELAIVLCVVVFIFCSFEHCVANFFFLALSNKIELVKLGLMIAGNAAGSIITNKLYRYERKSIVQ